MNPSVKSLCNKNMWVGFLGIYLVTDCLFKYHQLMPSQQVYEGEPSHLAHLQNNQTKNNTFSMSAQIRQVSKNTSFSLSQNLLWNCTQCRHSCWPIINVIYIATDTALKAHAVVCRNIFDNSFSFHVICQMSPNRILEKETICVHLLWTAKPLGLNRVAPCALHTGLP